LGGWGGVGGAGLGGGGKQRPDKPLSATDEDEEPRETDNLQSLCVSGCAALPGLIALMLLASRLDGGPLSTQSLAVSGALRSCLGVAGRVRGQVSRAWLVRCLAACDSLLCATCEQVVFSPVFAVCGLVLLIVSCAIICIRKVGTTRRPCCPRARVSRERCGQRAQVQRWRGCCRPWCAGASAVAHGRLVHCRLVHSRSAGRVAVAALPLLHCRCSYCLLLRLGPALQVVHVNEAYDDEEEMDEEMGGQGHEAGDTAPTADVEGHDAAPAAPAIILSGPPDAGGASGAPIVLAPVNGAVADATAGASMQSDALSGPAAEVSELAAAASEAAAPALIQTLDDTEAPKTEAEASKQQAKESIAPPPSDAAPHENPAS
jgi:hypothetical protein